MKRLCLLCFSLLFVVVSGCSQMGIISSNHLAAVELAKRAGAELDPERPIIAASFTDINNLDKSSSFGRIASQHLASQFSTQGYTVIEMLLRSNVYIKKREGEFLLSRALRNISSEHNAQAVIVGTYAVGATKIFVTSKIIRTDDSMVLASYDYALDIDSDIKELLSERRSRR